MTQDDFDYWLYRKIQNFYLKCTRVLKDAEFHDTLKEIGKLKGLYKITYKKEGYSSEFRRISSLLLKDAVCSDCGKDKTLQVHHIDKDKKNNSQENLVVLCWKCHAKHHKHMRKMPSFFNK